MSSPAFSRSRTEAEIILRSPAKFVSSALIHVNAIDTGKHPSIAAAHIRPHTLEHVSVLLAGA